MERPPAAMVKPDPVALEFGPCAVALSSPPPRRPSQSLRHKNPLPNIRPRWNAAPTDPLPVVLVDRDTGGSAPRGAALGAHSLLGKGCEDRLFDDQRNGEAVADKPAFREPFKSRRCLVPANGFYEWQKLDAKTKQPFHIGMADGPVRPCRALGPLEGPRERETIRSFTIVTTTPTTSARRSTTACRSSSTRATTRDGSARRR